MSARSVAVTAILLAIASAACQRSAPEAGPLPDADVALLEAASEGRVHDVRTLLDQGADVNLKARDGSTPLMFAALGGRTEVVSLLLERGTDVNAEDEHGWTTLMLAAQGGHTEVVDLLLEHGADVNARTHVGLTALGLAKGYGHTEVVSLLLERGAHLDDQGYLPPPPNDTARLGDQPVFTLYTARPQYRSIEQARRIVERHYPKLLKDAGIGGTVMVWVFIDTNGRVQNVLVKESSGDGALDAAALAAVRELEFTPARKRDVVVPIWVVVPITFSMKRPGKP